MNLFSSIDGAGNSYLGLWLDSIGWFYLAVDWSKWKDGWMCVCLSVCRHTDWQWRHRQIVEPSSIIKIRMIQIERRNGNHVKTQPGSINTRTAARCTHVVTWFFFPSKIFQSSWWNSGSWLVVSRSRDQGPCRTKFSIWAEMERALSLLPLPVTAQQWLSNSYIRLLLLFDSRQLSSSLPSWQLLERLH